MTPLTGIPAPPAPASAPAPASPLAPWGSPLTAPAPSAQLSAPSPLPVPPSPSPAAELRVDLVALPSGDVLARTPCPSLDEAARVADALMASLAAAPALRALSAVFAVRTLVRGPDGWSLHSAELAVDDGSASGASPSLPQEARP